MICKKCKRATEDKCFATYRDKNGIKRRRGICKECRGKYAIENFEELKKWRKKYNKKNRTKKAIDTAIRRGAVKKIIDDIKLKTKCADCKRKFHPVAMDFDHVRGKNRGIANMVSQSYKIDLILEEIKLCDIVCACCHRVRTHTRRQNHFPSTG